MYVVAEGQADANYSMAVPGVDLSTATVAFTSNNESSVSVIPNDPAHPEAGGKLHFGAQGVASLSALVHSTPDSKLLASFGCQITVDGKDPSSCAGGTITIEGLTESTSPEAPTRPGGGRPDQGLPGTGGEAIQLPADMGVAGEVDPGKLDPSRRPRPDNTLPGEETDRPSRGPKPDQSLPEPPVAQPKKK